MGLPSSRIRIPDFLAKKAQRRKITMLTAYDATMARLLDEAGIDVLLVGDSLGVVILGNETTIPVTMDAMVHHTRAVANGAKRALVIADLPFLSYQASAADAVRNAGRLVQEGGASAVKLEGGLVMAETVQRLVEIGIPVMGHIGLTPQSVHQLGGYRMVGKTRSEAESLVQDARALEAAGAFAVVLECIPEEIAAGITAALQIPTIGIGSGPYCDGQVLVSYDAFGFFEAAPRFVKLYARMGEEMRAAAREYIDDVEQGRFPRRGVSVQNSKR
ncbi:MAG TPA: 3-methyl-2-oxobutanoate hydroxymethyltransferase [Bryobacteraceae bacterium]|nr:3-methyl-2-oxobutanoate hydroxymethyltransferase [Bryobacteraceae bacterium]